MGKKKKTKNLRKRAGFECPQNFLLFSYCYLKWNPFILSCFTECMCQEEDVIHTNTKSKKWQNLQQTQATAALGR